MTEGRSPGGRRRAFAVLVSLSAALSIAACSSSNDQGSGAPSAKTGPIDSAFVARVQAVCEAAVVGQGKPLPVQNFDPLHPDPKDLPAVGAYFAKHGQVIATVQRIDALGEPSAGRSEWRTLRALIDQAPPISRRQIDAARRSDVSAFTKSVDEAKSLAEKINNAGGTAGFSTTSPCRRVFG